MTKEVLEINSIHGLSPIDVVSFEDLLPGDILLYCPANPSTIDEKIQNATSSIYSHVAIYIGNGEIAEMTLKKIQTTKVWSNIHRWSVISVFRTQYVFDYERVIKLLKFIDELIEIYVKYDIETVKNWEELRKEHNKDVLDILENSCEKFESDSEYNFFTCSGLIVACYKACEIIHKSANPVFPTKLMSPADIANTYCAWFLGYLIPFSGKVPDIDPLRSSSWKKQPSHEKWWQGETFLKRYKF